MNDDRTGALLRVEVVGLSIVFIQLDDRSDYSQIHINSTYMKEVGVAVDILIFTGCYPSIIPLTTLLSPST